VIQHVAVHRRSHTVTLTFDGSCETPASTLLAGAAVVTAPTASGAEAVCPATRVKALDDLSPPRDGVRSPESPGRYWENRPRYDGKAVGTVLARYYDPATAQFLSVDPKVARTLSPYGYVDGNPLNETDPRGDCGLWGSDTCLGDAAGWVGNNIVQPVSNVLHDNEFGWCVQASAGALLGVSGSGCFVLNANGIGFTGTIGGQLTAGASAGITTGPFIGIGARMPEDLGNVFGYAGASGGAGPSFDATIAGGTGQCGQPVTTIYIGGGWGLGLSGQAGVSNTWVWQP